MSDLEKFAEFLFGNRSGYVYVATKKRDSSWGQHFFNWPLQKQKILDFVKTSSIEDDVYVSPALFSDKSGKKESIKDSSVVWIEFDGKAEIDYKGLPEPDLVVQTSTSSHLHCYWKLDSPIDVSTIEDINRRLTYYLEADSSGWDASQVLRPPDTTNWKSVAGKPVRLLKLEDNSHAVGSFDRAPSIETPLAIIVYDNLIPEHELKIPNELKDRIFRQIAVEPTRSSFLMSTGYLLAEAGMDALEIVSALYLVDCRIKKFVGRTDQLIRLSEIASIAIMKSQTLDEESYSPLEIVNHELDLEWYLEGWLHSKGIMILSGAPGVGKTQFALYLGYCLSTGVGVFNKTPGKPLTVGVLSLEMEVVELKYILARQASGYDNLTLWDSNTKVFTYEEGSLGAYEKTIEKHRPDVLIIDSLSELANDDLAESEARKIMRWLKKMRRLYDCSMIVIHHNRKASDTNKKPRKLSDLYGSFIFAKLSETVISLWAEEGSNLIELDTLKTRFGRTEHIKLKRDDNLVFHEQKATVEHNPLLGTLDIGFN